MELAETKEQGGKGTVLAAGQGKQAPGTGKGVYVNLRGRFAGQQYKVQARLLRKSGQGLDQPKDVNQNQPEDSRQTGNGGKVRQHGGRAGKKKPASRSGSSDGGRGFRNTVRHSNSYGDGEEYSSTCCGKCRYFLRQWRGGVWICSNEEGEKSGLPTNYASTCPLFAHEDWSRDNQGQQKPHSN